MKRVPLGLMMVPLLAGCYTMQPLVGSRPEPAPGTRLIIELTDAGRVAMTDQMGPEVARFESRLVRQTDSAYVLSVSLVISVWGAQTRWNGEQVTLRTEYVRTVGERRFSAGRTAVVAAGAAGGILAFVLTRNLLGGGNTADPTDRPPPPNGS
jgi:hypothetical protein